jgi:hypothetical protein
MRTRLFLLIAFLLTAALILAACAPAEEIVPTESPEEAAPPAGAKESYPLPESDVTAPPAEEAYPAPEGETEIYIPITGSEDAYPAPPDEPVEHPVLVGTPYPVPDVANLVKNIDPEDIVKFDDLQPQAGDSKLTPGNVYIESAEAITQMDDVMSKESGLINGPVLLITGCLPTPCNQLRVTVAEPDKDRNIEVVAYSVIDPDVMCIQVLEPFAAFIPLTDLPAGQYNIIINDGEQTVGMTVPEK